MSTFSKELKVAYKYNVRLEEIPESEKSDSIIIYGLTPLLPMHLGFDPIIATLRYFKYKGFKIKIIFGDTYLRMEDKLKIGPKEYENVCNYYKYIFQKCGLENAEFVLHSDATANSTYWFQLANIANDMSLRNVYQSIPGEYRNDSIPLAKSLHTLMQTNDIEYFGATHVLGSLTQERIYYVSRDLLRKNDFDIPGVILISETQDLFGQLLKFSSSKSRLSYHEDSGSLKNKLGQLNSSHSDVIRSLFINSVMPYEKSSVDGKPLTIEVLNDFLEDESEKTFAKVISLLYNGLITRLEKLNKDFKKTPELISWIDLDRVRGY